MVRQSDEVLKKLIEEEFKKNKNKDNSDTRAAIEDIKDLKDKK
jgi:hypothetical protein